PARGDPRRRHLSPDRGHHARRNRHGGPVDPVRDQRLRRHRPDRVRPHRLIRMPSETAPARHRFDLDVIGAGLPVDAARAELEASARTGAMVVTAPPGTGKTTLVPPLVANLVGGLTLVTQPRRVAVRAAARRLASLDGSPLGGPVGFTVRSERTVGKSTAVEMLTPGVLLRRLLADPELPGVAAVMLDEVHERSLETDLLLGMLAEARQL